MAIQGDGAESPLRGRWVTTEGVVTLCTRDGRRCWIQDPRGDGDPRTSDGLALELGRGSPVRLRSGDRVRVQGRVRERRFGNALPHTVLDPVRSVRRVARSRPLPAPLAVERLPDRSLREAIAFWEAREGMRVRIAEGRVVGPTSRYGEFVLLARGNLRPGSGYHPDRGHLLLRAPGPGEAVDYNPERIVVGATTRRRPLQVRVGDVVRGLVGVVDYSYGNYKLQPEHLRTVAAEPARAPVPVQRPTLATFNLENLFDAVDDPEVDDGLPTPEEVAAKLDKLSLALTESLGLPAVVAVQEVENTAVLQRLADAVNSRTDSAYRALSFDSSDGRGIEVGVLWDTARASLVSAGPLSGPAVQAAFGGGGREPLEAKFRLGTRTLTLLVVHFKSKAGDDPLFGRRRPPRRPTEALRKAQARAVRDAVERRLRTDPHAWLAVAGDINDFPFAEPGEGPDHPLAILAGPPGPRRLVSVLESAPEAERFTYLYHGNSQVLDYILVSPRLRAVLAEARAVHVNTPFPHALGGDPRTPWRSSDHDPLVARFRLAAGAR